VPYPLFSYSGLLPWQLVSNAVQTSSQSLIANSYIITKVYYPRLIIPLAVVGVRLVDFFVSALMLFMMMLYYGVHPGRHLLLFPLLVVQVMLLTLGAGIWSSVMTARYRDIGSLLTVLLQLWMFASPVIYPSRLVPERWRLLYSCNPLAGLVEGIRSSLFGLEFNWTSIAISAVITLALLAYSVRAFCRMEEKVIDIL
jgi:lipopolysaccharide transport system permease protein